MALEGIFTNLYSNNLLPFEEANACSYSSQTLVFLKEKLNG